MVRNGTAWARNGDMTGGITVTQMASTTTTNNDIPIENWVFMLDREY